MMKRRVTPLALLLTLSLLLCGCKQNPTEKQLYAKLLAHFTDRGLACTLVNEPPVSDPAIYDASAWKTLDIGGESVYVYFDESNRADYLLEQVDQEKYGYATRFGLRFVLNYRGEEEALLKALREMNE